MIITKTKKTRLIIKQIQPLNIQLDILSKHVNIYINLITNIINNKLN